MIQGFDHFVRYFSNERNEFVIIGGVASGMVLQTGGFQARPTRDIDLVILVNPSLLFAGKIRRYVEEGQYQSLNASEDGEKPVFYRFEKPIIAEFPPKIELLSRKAIDLKLNKNQRIIPIETPEEMSDLSAIMLEDDYFLFLQNHIRTIRDVPVASEIALIPLKAKAYLDLRARRESGKQVNSRDIEKHVKDVLRLSRMLSDQTSISVADSIREDLKDFLDKAEEFDENALRISLGEDFAPLQESIEAMRRYFRL